jgi:hypothetical protein
LRQKRAHYPCPVSTDLWKFVGITTEVALAAC